MLKLFNTKILLWCGIIACLMYISTDIFLAIIWDDYSYVDQSISELSAIGSPTRSRWIAMSFLFNPLLIAFGIGVWKIANKTSLRLTGILLSVWGILGFVWLLFPMHMRGEIGSTTDTMHLVMLGVTVPLMMLFLGIGSVTQGRWFRLYTWLTMFSMLVFGVLVTMQVPLVAAQLPTPFMGIMERVSVYFPMIWIIVLAVSLLRVYDQKMNWKGIRYIQ